MMVSMGKRKVTGGCQSDALDGIMGSQIQTQGTEVVLNFIKCWTEVVKIRIPLGIPCTIFRIGLPKRSVVGTDGPGLELKSIIPFIPFLE